MANHLQNIDSCVADVEYQYDEVRNATGPYALEMALSALGLALQELREALSRAHADLDPDEGDNGY